MHSHKNTHTHNSNVKTHKNGRRTPTSRYRYPKGATGPRRSSLSFRGGDQQTAPAPAQTSAGTIQTRMTPAQIPTPHSLGAGGHWGPPAPNDPRPHPQRGPQAKREVYLVQTSPPTRAVPGRNSPNPPMNSDLNPMSSLPPMNPNINLPTRSPPTRTQISNTCP
ncbi:hypothetical protein AMECASPLE_008402 [Ameca splendens]|uniref:60S ribosomal protein L29 n=1 Tax=Ameca splendens TaxID=208324 RepID=A0ABV0YY01_9TELE